LKLDKLYTDKATILFFILGGFFICNALVAEFIGIKIFSLERTLGFEPFDWEILGVDGLGFSLTAGVLLWPVVFVMTDIINEYFGSRGVKRLSYFAVILICYAFVMVFLAIHLAPNDWWQNVSGVVEDKPDSSLGDMDLAFAKIMGQGLWIIIGSLVAFLVGQIVDVFVFQQIKKKTGESKIWLRATGSTLVSQLIDSYVVLLIAFWIGADWDLVRVFAIGTVNYIYKFIMAIILTPVIYLAHYLIDKWLGNKLANQLKFNALEK
jgi:uncharacterized integral membrane protein (TIGR00697 family)